MVKKSEQPEQPEQSRVEKAAAKIVYKTYAAKKERKLAQERLQRCTKHVAELRQRVADIPDELIDLNSELVERVADGRPLTACQRNIKNLRDEMDANQQFLKNESKKFEAEAQREERHNQVLLQAAIDDAADTVIEPLGQDFLKGIEIAFDAYEDWYEVKNQVAAKGLPRPYQTMVGGGKVMLNAARLVVAFRDPDKLHRFKMFVDVLAGDIARSKNIVRPPEVVVPSMAQTPTPDGQCKGCRGELVHDEKRDCMYCPVCNPQLVNV